MHSNVRGWHNIPIATVLINFSDGRFVKFLHRCCSACRFDQIVSDLYKRRIAFKPLFLALIRCIVCPSPTTTRGAIPSRPFPCPFRMFIYVIVCIFRPPRAVGHGFRRPDRSDSQHRNMYPLPRAWWVDTSHRFNVAPLSGDAIAAQPNSDQRAPTRNHLLWGRLNGQLNHYQLDWQLNRQNQFTN